MEIEFLNMLLRRHIHKGGCIYPWHLFSELEDLVEEHNLIKDEKERESFMEFIEKVKDENLEIAQDELKVDGAQIDALCKKYTDNVRAYLMNQKTDKKFMRSIEARMYLRPWQAEEYRVVLMKHLCNPEQSFDYKKHVILFRALQLELFDSVKENLGKMGYCEGCVRKLMTYASKKIQD